MAVEIVMPKFGLTMHEGTLQQWFKAEGERVEAGEKLFEVETEKVLYEVEAPVAGILVRCLYPADATIPVATVVAVIAEAGDDPAEVAARYAAPVAPQAVSGARPSPVPPAPAAPDGRGAERVPATPAARKRAKELGVDLSQLRGTGPGGRISREDVEAAATGPRLVPLAGIRKTIAARMHQSLQTTAQVTITSEVDVTEMVQQRSRVCEEPRPTYTDFLVAAAARALRAHPRLNATVDGDAVHQHAAVHIGLAVALDDGLVVPVLRDADRKDLREIAAASARLAAAARAGTLGPDDLTGGTFSITNLGMYGVDAFTPILNLPQVAILGVGRVREKPAVADGAIVPRHFLTLSLTFDHRVVDGAPAAAFLRSVARELGGALLSG